LFTGAIKAANIIGSACVGCGVTAALILLLGLLMVGCTVLVLGMPWFAGGCAPATGMPNMLTMLAMFARCSLDEPVEAWELAREVLFWEGVRLLFSMAMVSSPLSCGFLFCSW
jgi:hypothetical protein